jgi:S-adenosylmethionine-diacylglycerol 3-amino-3-carboxypropyl transferase
VLEYEALLAFLGVRATNDRLRTYKGLASQLSTASRDFWDAHPDSISQGIIHAGRFEDYFRLFRKRVLPLIHSKRTVTELLQPKDLAARQTFWTQRWNNRRWRMLFRIFFGRFLMGRLGRDPEFFRYVEGSISDRLLQRTHFGLTQIPTDQNPFLHYIATGNFGSALPRYLRRENFTRIREGLDRLTVHHGPIEQAAQQRSAGGYDGLNLSDVFEYVNEESSSTVYSGLVESCRPGARIAYWNTLVPRSCPQELTTRVKPLNELSQELHAEDKAFFYCHFQVDEVLG